MKLKLTQTSLALMMSATMLMSPSASAEVTAPAGYVQLTFTAEADTPFSLPMNRPKVYSGELAAVSENEISISSDDLVANDLVYDSENQTEKYYVLFTTGILEGQSFDITANTANSITVDPGEGADIDTLIDVSNQTLSDSFEIRPHWTMNTLFPDGEGFPAVDSRFVTESFVFIRPRENSGINHSASEGYMFVNGVGWVNVFNVFEFVGDRILERNSFYVFRNTEPTDVVKNVIGDVPTVDSRIRLFGNLIPQDNYISFSFPTSLTLDDTGLENNPNFNKASNKFIQDGDILFGYQTDPTGFNGAAETGYFFVDGEGWYDAFDVFGRGILDGTTDIDSVGRGFFLRKQAENEQTKTQNLIELPYNPNAE